MLEIRKQIAVVSDNAKILILKQITTMIGNFSRRVALCLIMQRY